MNVTTCEDQAACNIALNELGVREVFRPFPGQVICDGIVQLGKDCWLVGTNDRGTFTLHLLEDTTKEEAWKFFDALHGGCGHTNSRIAIIPRGDVPATNN